MPNTLSEDQLSRSSNWLGTLRNELSVSLWNLYPFHLHHWRLWHPSAFICCSIHIFLTFICLKMKWSFLSWTQFQQKRWRWRGTAGECKWPPSENMPVFPLDVRGRCEAIFVISTLINTSEAVGEALVPAAIVLLTTQPFSLNSTNSSSLSLILLPCGTACSIEKYV